ncbi:F0F1 ATP synthase subunit delta [Virgibacillus profundi]|uniref:ATP synthase subunit delta n=1 Tax=Virgibacillus profundi TaxID=2024555 RepID=A0A2A2IIA5_9BACI|nr:F0F1 ATP synthase subunit delta [Virgibacillus profundi]PAV31357.1 F0F1 ATP synthase subunit delta [Virgibacillus profundi]PXY55543.1 F0F1 ATP synthase subunit delta [Virgibacillus profundi]
MSEAVVAKRYAEALFQLGNEKATLDQMVDDFQVVKEVFQANKKLNTFLKHPRINNTKKKQFLDEVFQGLDPDVITTLKLLVDRHRTDIIPSMVDHFNQFVNDAKGIAEVTVYSVRKLSNPERSHLVASFVKRFNKSTFEINNVIDPTLIGGVKIRVGNTIIDGSISRKLQRIERDIVTANK